MKYRTDLILGEAFCIFILFYFPDYGIGIFYGLHFFFWWRDGETGNKQLLFSIQIGSTIGL